MYGNNSEYEYCFWLFTSEIESAVEKAVKGGAKRGFANTPPFRQKRR